MTEAFRAASSPGATAASLAALPSDRTLQSEQINFLGCRVDLCTSDDVMARAMAAMRHRRRLQHCDINVAKLMTIRRDPELRLYTEDSDIVCADGMGIVWGCRLLGFPLRERITGIDLTTSLLDVCAREGFRPYFLGGKNEIVKDLVAQVRHRYPKIDIAGWRNGYFTPREEAGIVREISAARADCLFVGISSPIKERFLHQYRDALNVPVQLGVGGAFDVLSGHVSRAPPWMQRFGLEWLHRLMQEPRRLWRRYLATNAEFAGVLAFALAEKTSRRLRGKG